jgi:hypothetical protein
VATGTIARRKTQTVQGRVEVGWTTSRNGRFSEHYISEVTAGLIVVKWQSNYISSGTDSTHVIEKATDLVASEGKEQVGRTDTAEECDGGPIPMEQLRYREGTRKSVDKSCVALRVTKRRQEARLGTGMHIVNESSPQIEVMGRSQDQLPETPLARKNKMKKRASAERKIAVYVGQGVPLIGRTD